jgi:hypothetical protein
MSHVARPVYGLRTLVVVNSVVFILLALSVFLVALFTEMHGFPLHSKS